MHHKRPRSAKLICNIDVSSFAAILMVLLFTFMLATTAEFHYREHNAANLAIVAHPKLMPGANREDALKIAILRDGKIFFGTEWVAAAELPAKIRQGLSRGAERKVYIIADPRVHYWAVLEVLDGVRSAGVGNIAFLVYERKHRSPV